MQNIVSIPQMDEASSSGEPAELAAAAHRLGLRQVRAWMPDEASKSRSAGAKRTKRARENAALQGNKQLSVTLPAELHEPVKALAARIRAGEPAAQVWADLSPAQNQTPTQASLPRVLAKPLGWRRWLLRWLLPSEYKGLVE